MKCERCGNYEAYRREVRGRHHEIEDYVFWFKDLCDECWALYGTIRIDT